MVKVGMSLKMQFLMPSCPETKPLSVSLICGCSPLAIALFHSLPYMPVYSHIHKLIMKILYLSVFHIIL